MITTELERCAACPLNGLEGEQAYSVQDLPLQLIDCAGLTLSYAARQRIEKLYSEPLDDAPPELAMGLRGCVKTIVDGACGLWEFTGEIKENREGVDFSGLIKRKGE
jgi:hypothetical protein